MQGYFGGLDDLLFQRFIEIWSGLPVLYLLIILASVVEPNFWWLLGLMLLFSWMALVGVVRAEFLRARNFDYVRAARALGVSDRVIMFRHVLPNAMVATLTFMPFVLNGSITTLTSLDFLGFGLPPGSPSLGELLAQGKANLQAPWLGLTGFFVARDDAEPLIFIGEAVRDAFDPRKDRRDLGAASAAADAGALLEVRDLSVCVRHVGGRRGARGAIRCLASTHRRAARPLALVGESGSGKSVTALSILQLLPYPLASHPGGQHPASAARSWSARRRATLRQVRGNQIAMIFQEPMTSLNPLHTLEQQINEMLLIHKDLTRRGGARAHARAPAPGRPARRREPARRLSAPALGRAAAAGDDRDGARQRARLLIADEPTTALDVTIQAQILQAAAGPAAAASAWRCCSSPMISTSSARWPTGSAS